MGRQTKFPELKAFCSNVKIVVTVETLENLIKRKTQMTLFYKEKKSNNGYMILFKNDFLKRLNHLSLILKSVNIYINYI